MWKNRIGLVLRGVRMFLVGLVSLVLLDMFVLHGWLKDFFVRANTSDYSPFSTDGQSNWILVLISIGVILVISYLLIKTFGGTEENK
jgi:hypothetical protein